MEAVDFALLPSSVESDLTLFHLSFIFI